MSVLGDGGVVNASHFLPLFIGLQHLPRVHVNKPADQQNNFIRASRFLYISFPSSHDCDVLKKLHVLLGISEHGTRTFFFFSSLFGTVRFLNSAPEKFANICRIERGGISAMKFKTARIHFLSDVIAATY